MEWGGSDINFFPCNAKIFCVYDGAGEVGTREVLRHGGMVFTTGVT